MNTCFFIPYSNDFTQMAKGCANSIRKFYDDPIIEYPFVFEGKMPDSLYLALANVEYKRVIFFNADSVMCAPSPRLFEVYEYGMPINNGKMWGSHPYMNNGLQVVTNKQIWIDQRDMIDREGGKEQDNSNRVFWDRGYKNCILDTDTESYGIRDYDLFENAELRGQDIFVNNRKMCIFHFATAWHKDYKIAYERFTNRNAKFARNRIKELVS